MADSLTVDEDEDEWPYCRRYVVWPVVRLPPLKPGDLDRTESRQGLGLHARRHPAQHPARASDLPASRGQGLL